MKKEPISNVTWDSAKQFYDKISEELLNSYNFYHYAYIGENDDEFFDFIVKKSEIQNGSKVLDLGCGSGYLTNRLRGFCDPTGLTNSKVCLEVAKKRFPECSFILEDMQKYENPNYYDNILNLESFGHSENPWKTLELVFKNLKKGGKYYVKDFFVLPKLTFRGKLNLIHWSDYFKYSKFTYQQFITEAEKIGFNLIIKEDLEKKINETKANEVTVDSYYEYPFPDEPYLEYLGILLQKP